MANLADIPAEFLDATKINEFLVWLRMLPITPLQKRDLLFIWRAQTGASLTTADIAKSQTSLI